MPVDMLQSTREDQISCLLDKINNKGRKEFEIFLQYLLNWYSWITDAYMNCARSPDNNSLEELENILDEGEVPPLPLRSVKRQNEVKFHYCRKIVIVKFNKPRNE